MLTNDYTNPSSVIEEVHRRFNLYTEQGDSASIPGDFIELIFSNAVRYGGHEEYEKIMKIYKKPPTPQHKVACMRALCTTRDDKLIEKTITFMNSDDVKLQDMMLDNTPFYDWKSSY